MAKKTYRILFVCLSNICRSPAGAALLKHLSEKDSSISVEVDSCGIGDWHIGSLPDHRMLAAAMNRGVVLSGRSRQLTLDDLNSFDLILAADQKVLRYLYQIAKTPEQKSKIHLMTDFSEIYKGQEIPDPYFHPEGAFDLVLDMLEESCQGILSNLRHLY